MINLVFCTLCAILVLIIPVNGLTEIEHVNIDGDFILGALFPIHTLGSSGICGPDIDDQNGIQNLEAFLYSRTKANNEVLKGTGIKIGVLVYDSCYSETVALDRALEFVKLQPQILGLDSMYECASGPVKIQKLTGVVGSATSNVCVQLASLFRLFKIPQISYSATSPELSDRTKYEYFMRTVPPDNFQSQAIVAILEQFNWKYIIGIYEDTSYGQQGFEVVKQYADIAGICIGKIFKVNGHSSNTTQQRTEIKEILTDALRFNNTAGKIVAVLYTIDSIANTIFEIASSMNGGDRFIWVGSDGWTGKTINTKGMKIANNALGIQPKTKVVPDFDKYFESLNITHGKENPWFYQYWQQVFNCTYASDTSGLKRNTKRPQCTGKEKLSGAYVKNKNTYAVMDAVYAFAHALKALHNDKCGYEKGVCEAMENIYAEQLKPYLLQVNFTGIAGLDFNFINNGSGPVRYSLVRYIQNNTIVSWEDIDQFDLKEKSQNTSKNDSYFPNLVQEDLPYKPSKCSAPCKQGEAKTYKTAGLKCCWTCEPCKQHQYLMVHNLSCGECQKGYQTNATRTGCEPLLETTMDIDNVWAIIPISLTCLGVIVTVIVAGIFYWQKETPLIMASGKEMSFVLLLGIMLSYLSSFAFVSYPTSVSCGVTRFILGLSYTVCYSAILVKTNRIYRVFNINTSKPKKVKFINAKSQILITFAIVGVEILALTFWLVFEPPVETFMYPTRHIKIRVCKDATDYSYLGVLTYPFMLMILCVYYAFRTRKTPDGFNETRYITFGSYSFCVLWIAFTSIYFSVHDTTIRVVALCFASFINATVTLITLFITKTYVVIFRPQKNTRENVMARRRTHSYDTVNINSLNNLSRLPSAVSTWHSVNQRFDSQDSTAQTITINPKPKFGNKLSVSVLSLNNVDQLDGSMASNLNIVTVPNNHVGVGNIDQDIVVVTTPHKKTSTDLGDERLQQFLDSNEHHHDADINNGIGQSVPRRSLRSFKSRRKRRRTLKRARSLDVLDVPNIVITSTPEDLGTAVHL
ncbi:hypothetical protein ACF0H5_019648 [Mactra antiquata]